MSETTTELIVTIREITPLFERAILNVREDIQDNPYILEALRVLPVQGYRSAIGCVWNAVVDDLRNKIIFRSLSLFNKTQTLRRLINTYEDFQEFVNDDELIEGAYKIGVISWEAKKVLKHAKETRHIFDGHPKSSEPSVIKVLAMLDDCIKYVLSIDYPPKVIDINEYLGMMGESEFDRNMVSIETALGDLPEVYKNELSNRFYKTYIRNDSSSTLKSNIAFVAPILWKGLPKSIKVQISRNVDHEIASADKFTTESAFEFIRLVDSDRYLSITARKYKVYPIITKLSDNLYNFTTEDECIKELSPYASFIPDDLYKEYIIAIMLTYIGTIGHSGRYNRTDWYANTSAIIIPSMVEQFDDRMAVVFVEIIKTDKTLIKKITNPAKLRRLRKLALIVKERISNSFPEAEFLEILTNEEEEKEFFKILRKKN